MRKPLFIALLILLPATTKGEMAIVDSLEWMTVDSTLIICGKVTDCMDASGPHEVIYRDITIQIKEVLKGNLRGTTLKVRLRLLRGDTQGTTWEESGHSFLFFLRKGRLEDDKGLVGWWVRRERRQSIIDLEKPQRVYLANMKRPKDAKEILSIVRRWATWKKHTVEIGAPNIFKPQTGYLRLELQPGADVFHEVYAGSACYINVPAEEKYRSLALSKAKSQKAWERREGAEMLVNYPGAETIRILRTLLYDTTEQASTESSDKLVRIGYPLRRSAYESLIALGQKPTKPAMERTPTPQEIENFRFQRLERTVWELLPDDWIVCSIKDVNEPVGWKRRFGDQVIKVECAHLDTTETDSKKTKLPILCLYVMPYEWEGRNITHRSETLIEGRYTPAIKKHPTGHISHPTYLGHTRYKHFFLGISDSSAWPDAKERIQKYFQLQTN